MMNFTIENYSVNGVNGTSITRYNSAGEPEYKEEYYGSTAQEWLDMNGYDAMRLVALSDVERQLAAANKSSAAMQAARQWISSVLALYVANPNPRSDWPAPPADFHSTISDGLNSLLT